MFDRPSFPSPREWALQCAQAEFRAGRTPAQYAQQIAPASVGCAIEQARHHNRVMTELACLRAKV